MADRPKAATRYATFLWFVTTAFSVFGAVLRYRRLGEVTWYLVAAAAFTLVMGIATLRRSRSGGV